MDVDNSQDLLDLEKEYDNPPMDEELNETLYVGGLTTSFVFKMDNVENFVKDKLASYILDVRRNLQGLLEYLIDTSKLVPISSSDYFGSNFAGLVAGSRYTYSEQLKIVVFKNNFALIADTLYISAPEKNIEESIDSSNNLSAKIQKAESEDKSSDSDGHNEQESSIRTFASSLYRALFVQKNPRIKVCKHLRKEYSNLDKNSEEYSKIEEDLYDAKYWEADLYANSYAAKLIDIIINSSLNLKGEYNKVSFFFPKGTEYSEIEYKLGGWKPLQPFGVSFEGASINFLLYSDYSSIQIEEKQQIVDYIESVLATKNDGCFISEQVQENINDTFFTYSLYDGLSVVLFKRFPRFAKVDYEEYYYNFISRVIDKIECVSEWKKYSLLLENAPNRKYKNQFFKRIIHRSLDFLKNLSPGYRRNNGVHPEELMLRLEIMENDILQEDISSCGAFAAKRWLKKTNTLEYIKYLESMCGYFSKIKGYDEDDRNGKILNLIGVLTIASAVFDFWAIMDKNPGGSYIVSSVVAAIIILITFICWPRR